MLGNKGGGAFRTEITIIHPNILLPIKNVVEKEGGTSCKTRIKFFVPKYNLQKML